MVLCFRVPRFCEDVCVVRQRARSAFRKMSFFAVTLCFAAELFTHSWIGQAGLCQFVGLCSRMGLAPVAFAQALSGGAVGRARPSRTSHALAARHRRVALRRQALFATDEELQDLAPPDIGEPEVPDLLEPWTPSGPEPVAKLPVPDFLVEAHDDAVRAVLEGYRRGLRRSTVVVPSGLGDGLVGAAVIKHTWDVRKRTVPTFRALVLVSEQALQDAEEAYRDIAGAGLFVLPIEPGRKGIDLVAKALETARGLVLLGTYADAPRFAMALARTRSRFVDLAVYDNAHIAHSGDPSAKDLLQRESKFRCKVLQELFVSARSMEEAPTKGLQNATKEVPGVASYHVVTVGDEHLFGPELFSLPQSEAESRGLTSRVELVFLPKTFVEKLGKAAALAELHKTLGVSCIALSDTMEATEVAKLRDDVQGVIATDSCRVGHERDLLHAPSDPCPEALVLGEDASHKDQVSLTHSVGRLVLRSRRETVYLVVLGTSGPVVDVAWKALLDFNERFEFAFNDAVIESGRLGRSLQWEDLPERLQGVKVLGAKRQASQQNAVTKVVNDAIGAIADEWFVWYGRLIAYQQKRGMGAVPVEAVVDGHELGRWLARQYLEWRWGRFDTRKQRLMSRISCSLQLESDRYFEEGLREFEQYIDQYQDPYVPPEHWTHSGFALGAWAVAQRAAWRQGKLTVEQQYQLDDVCFGPVVHPEKEEAREVTMYMENRMRDGRGRSLDVRRRVFRSLVMLYHPDFYDGEFAEVATQFLAGYREWFLNPPPRTPPEPLDRDVVWRGLSEALA